MKRIASSRAGPQFSAQHIAAGAQTGYNATNTTNGTTLGGATASGEIS